MSGAELKSESRIHAALLGWNTVFIIDEKNRNNEKLTSYIVCVVFFFKLMAVYEEQEAQQRGVANTSLSPSPDLYQSELSVFQPITGGEIEVNSSALKSSEWFFIE